MSLGLRLLRVVLVCCAAVAIVSQADAQQPVQPPAGQAKPPVAKPALPLPPSQSGGQNQPLKDPVVAIVNGQALHLSELEVAQQALPPQYRNVPLSAVYAALLDRIVDSKLVVQEGRKNKVTDDPAFKHRMAFVEDQVIQDFWLQKEIARKATPEKMHQRYEERLKSLPSDEEVHARHILVATEDEAKALIAQVKKGASFEKLAREKSTDKASGGEGGDLGWFKKTDMVKEFADAAFALNKGEMSETPVKTQFGYHIILLEDRRKAPPPTFDEMSQEIREELAKEAVNGFLNQLRANAKVEKFNIDGSKQTTPPAGQPAAPTPPAKPAAPSGGK